MSLLEVREATLRFGGVTALDRVSFDVEEGEVFAVVGPNGAGKSTLFNLVSRFHDPAAGRVRFDGRSLLDLPASAIAGLGIARTFQNTELFERSTVLANLLVGRHVHRRASLAAQLLLFIPSVRREEIAHREAVERVIDLLDLQPYRERAIAGLAYGVRKVVEIGRALAMEPRLILLDEPASGLSFEEVVSMRFWIEDIRSRLGVTVVMVEHDMGLVSAVSDRVLALAEGRVIALGTPGEVRSHPVVVEAYLGTDPGTATGTDPGTDTGTDPGTATGTDPGTATGTDPGTAP